VLVPARRSVFCASLADVFDNDVPDVWRAELFGLIYDTPNLDWLLLTKRIGNAVPMIADALYANDLWTTPWPWRHVHLGATVVNQAEAERDIPKLLATPAAVRFLSIEPMLGPVDLTIDGLVCLPCRNAERMRMCPETGAYECCAACDHTGIGDEWGIDWVIAGGESGPHARPAHPDWFRSLRDQCAAAGVPFLFKQWGEWCPRGPASLGYASVDSVARVRLTDVGEDGCDLDSAGENDVWMNRAGKRVAGRVLDGVTHDAFPVTR
jgi:protein gp37